MNADDGITPFTPFDAERARQLGRDTELLYTRLYEAARGPHIFPIPSPASVESVSLPLTIDDLRRARTCLLAAEQEHALDVLMPHAHRVMARRVIENAVWKVPVFLNRHGMAVANPVLLLWGEVSTRVGYAMAVVKGDDHIMNWDSEGMARAPRLELKGAPP